MSVRILQQVLFLLAAVSISQAQISLHYVNLPSQAQTRILATDSGGDSFVVFGVTEPSGRPQIRVIKSDPQGNQLASFDFGGQTTIVSGATTDAQGNLFVVGTTSTADFPPITPPPAAPPPSAAFVTKIDAQLKGIVFATRLGGSVRGQFVSTTGTAAAVDSASNVYITGNTSAPDFPVTQGAFQTQPPTSSAFGAATFAFLTKLDPTGARIIFSTYYGGNSTACNGGSSCVGAFGSTTANAIAADSMGAAVIAGSTTANALPITPGTPGQQCNCTNRAPASFVAKFSPDGTKLSWATFVALNHAGQDLLDGVRVTALALDSQGDVTIGGSASEGLPTTPGVLQPNLPLTSQLGAPGTFGGFVAEYGSSGQQLNFSTYVGIGELTGLVLDPQGNIWTTGLAQQSLPLPPEKPPLLGTQYVLELSPGANQVLNGFTAPAGAAGAAIAKAAGNSVALGTSGSLLTIGSAPASGLIGVTNSGGASVSGAVAPYELISLYGIGIGPSQATGAQITNGILATALAGTQVTFDGTPAPLLFAGPNQLNAIVPSEVIGRDTTVMQIITGNPTTASTTLLVTPSKPAVFTSDGFAFALDSDGSVNSQTNPASPGSIVTVWATGAGAMFGPETDGAIIGTTLHSPALPVSVLSQPNGQALDSLEVLYAGDAPDLATGIIQINFRMPSNGPSASPGVGIPFQLQVGDAISPAFNIFAGLRMINIPHDEISGSQPIRVRTGYIGNSLFLR